MAFDMGENAVANILGGTGNRGAGYVAQRGRRVPAREGAQDIANSVTANPVADNHAQRAAGEDGHAPDERRPVASTGRTERSDRTMDTTVILSESDRKWLAHEKLERRIARDGRPCSMSSIIVEAVTVALRQIEGGRPVEEVSLPVIDSGCRMSAVIGVDLWTRVFELSERLRSEGVPAGLLSMSAIARGGMAILRSEGNH